MVFQTLFNFLSPKQQQQKPQRQQQQQQNVPKPPLQQTSAMFVQKRKQQQKNNGQQQTRQQQTKQTKVDFIPKQNLPPIQQTSSSFQQQQFQTTSQLADAITQQVNKQTRSSGQQLSQMQKQKVKQTQMQQARNAHAQLLSYASQARSLLDEIKGLLRTRQVQTQQSKRQAQKVKNDANTIIAELGLLLEQISGIRTVQQKHIRQLQQLKTTLLVQAQGLRSHDQTNKKVIQHVTPDGNRLKISVDVKPDTKCCVAQALGQKTRYLRNNNF